MRYHLPPLFALALSLATATAQSISDIPSCAVNAAVSSISTSGCALNDLACVCKSKDWINSLLPAVQKDCSPADIEKTRDVTIKLCKANGVDVQLPSGTALTATTGATAAPGTLSPAAATGSNTAAGSSSLSSVKASATSNRSIASGASNASSSAATASSSGKGNAAGVAYGAQSGLLALMGVAVGIFVL